MDAGFRKSRNPNPRENAFLLSAATFCYTIPTFIQGFQRDLEEADLTETLMEHRSSWLGNKLEKHWKSEEKKASQSKSSPSLGKVLFKVFGLEFIFYGVILALSEAVRTAQPIILGQLLCYYQQGQAEITQEQAYWYAGGIVICSLINILFSHPYMMGVLHLGMKMRIGCCSLIYRKSLKLSKTALGQTTAGQVVNLLSNDVNRFDVAVLFAHQLWLGPIETIICTYLMYLQVGASAAVGVLILVMFIPMQIYLGKKISMLRLKTASRTDERVRLMNEIISGIQVIKMYAWEKPFTKLVSLTRRYEIKTIRTTSFMRGITLSFIMYSTRISIFVSILAYVLLGHRITAEKVFVLTSFYNILRQTMTVFFPQGISQVAEAHVSIKRLNQFLLYDETRTEKDIKESEVPKNDQSSKSNVARNDVNYMGIVIKNAVAKWCEASVDNTLTNLNLNVSPGKLMAIIGPVGSGKTSLLHVILQELPLESGFLSVTGDISYASQEPWLFAGTVRQNILFGLPMDRLKYRTVVRKCSLDRDFRLLPFGDKTIVGDRGVSLSGGQRARINLARAAYKQAEIYLLDDPLSAVDTKVGKDLFEQCITGYLKNKTVVLITHQLQYLKDVDHILYLDGGIPKAEGTFKELQASGLDFTKLLGDNQFEEEHVNEEIELSRQLSIRSVNSVECDAPKEVEEQKSTGSVGADVYTAYLKAGGNSFVIFMLLALFVVTQLFASAADYYITFWVNLEQRGTPGTYTLRNYTNENSSEMKRTIIDNESGTDFWHVSRETSIVIYSVITGILILTTLIRTFTFFTVCMKASTNLHDNVFSSMIRASMRFFNTNSAGRILNRFSKDIGSIDEILPSAMIDCLQIGLSLMGIIIVVGIVNPLLLIPTLGIGIVFYLLRVFYVRTSRNIKRLEGVTRSPVFSHLNASLQGLTTIRAFKAQEILIREFDNHQDLHSSAWFSFISTSRAFGYWLDLICIIYITFVTFSFFINATENLGGNVGLAITQAIGLTGMFQWGMRQSTELENQMTSVERVLHYNSIEHEAALESEPLRKPESTWPKFGSIQFKNVYLRYFLQDPFILNDLSFSILPNEKIGIVGRTGAGKSSLINALFQLTETQGEILIDNVNISKIGLHDLRSKISIIPQEPVLFSGTMRTNLDPFDEYLDADLWRSLEDVELKETVQDLTFGLNSKMAEGGSNFSVGQRQLVCLARAILRNNKILVLDEATANVDPQTDALIQNTIRQKFANCTVLTIAHRLNTVMDSDKVLVMDAGTLKEFDHPYKLLENPGGIFYSMVQQTGKTMAKTLYIIAEQSYSK